MEKVAASFVSILIGTPLYAPWLFARFGKYRQWYLAYFAPPFMWNKAIFAWPASAGFILLPVIGLLPIPSDLRTLILGIIGVLGVLIGFLMMLWTPRWAKPTWQQYLEDNYAWLEIRQVFIPHWRQMNRQTWNTLMDSAEGIDELVAMARSTHVE